MLSFDTALERILALAPSVFSHEVVSLDAARGRVLAVDLVSGVDLPENDHSAMDGYAICVDDLRGEGPWALDVRGESKTGVASITLEPGTTCRIFTGAPIPLGANAVVMQEVVSRDGDRATFTSRPAVGAHVRRRGEDMPKGSIAIAKGTRITSRHLSMAASLDRVWLDVTARPRVTVISTGDEIRKPGTSAVPGTIPESVGPAIAQIARDSGAIVTQAPIVPDD
ncbi:MAG: molybdopterin molybdotransferase MoeA, partial [Polyangiaceae bacterium]